MVDFYFYFVKNMHHDFSIMYCTLYNLHCMLYIIGWSDVSLFAIFVIEHSAADQVHFYKRGELFIAALTQSDNALNP